MPNLSTPITTPIAAATRAIKISAAVAACFAFSACGAIAEKVTEEGAERIIEAESGENVELDFDSGDGSFSVQTEEGSFAVNEDGEFVVTDADGSVFSGSASDDGLVVLDEGGDPVLNVDVDADGDNGSISIQGEDGEAVYRLVEEVPAEWPADVPRPEGFTVDAGSYASADGETLMTLIGTPTNGDAISYTDAYTAALTAGGMTETGRFDSTSDGGTTAQRSFENANWSMNINGYTDDATEMVNISIVSKN